MIFYALFHLDSFLTKLLPKIYGFSSDTITKSFSISNRHKVNQINQIYIHTNS